MGLPPNLRMQLNRHIRKPEMHASLVGSESSVLNTDKEINQFKIIIQSYKSLD